MNSIDQAVSKMWDSIFKLDSHQAVLIRGENQYPVSVSLDSVARIAETLYSALKIRTEIIGFVIQIENLPFFPTKGDVIQLSDSQNPENAKRYQLIQFSGKDYYQYMDTTRGTVLLVGYKI